MTQVPVAHQDLAHLVALAALTDDRTPGEQAALERVAARLDEARNRIAAANTRLDFLAPRVPCTWSTTHPDSDRQARTGGEHTRRCRCDGTGHVPPFTPDAAVEELVDAHGWSRAINTVRAG